MKRKYFECPFCGSKRIVLCSVHEWTSGYQEWKLLNPKKFYKKEEIKHIDLLDDFQVDFNFKACLSCGKIFEGEINKENKF